MRVDIDLVASTFRLRRDVLKVNNPTSMRYLNCLPTSQAKACGYRNENTLIPLIKIINC